MIEIGINKLSKSYGANKVFENVSFELHSNDIIGLIGRNGTGKTTLMKILLGEENAEGDISLRKGIKLSYLDQIPLYDGNETVVDVLYKAFSQLRTLKEQMTLLEKEMAVQKGAELDRILNRYSELQTEYEIKGGYDIEEKLARIKTGLKLEELSILPFKSLSGGEKTRVMLGKVLLENPDVLLLDEPTNHLDIEMVGWLEGYLEKYNGSVILISHDRYFLDKVVTKIIELHSNGAEVFHGNYSYYKVEKERRFLEAMKEYNAQQKKIKTMEEQIQRYRIWGEMRDSDKMYKRAKELEKRLSKIEKLDKPSIDKDIKLNFEQEHRSGKRIFELINVGKTYDQKELFKNVNFEILYQDCFTIIGGNGTGKTTLLKIILQEILPDEGELHVGARLNIGYLPQEVAFLDQNLTILETYQKGLDCTMSQARNALAGILFTKDDVFKKINVLSGGEKSRLKLLMLMEKKVNVLVLDEPTNHLDIESREILEHSLMNFDGTIIVISHDRYFINKLSNRIAEINDKKVKVYDGDYDTYLYEKQKEKDKEKGLENPNLKTPVKRNKKEIDNKKQSVSSEDILRSIEIKEDEINLLTQEMNLNWNDLDKLKSLSIKRDEIEIEIEKMYEQLNQFL